MILSETSLNISGLVLSNKDSERIAVPLIIRPNPEVLFVDDFNDEQISLNFYTDILPRNARSNGFKFIEEYVSDENLNFFRYILGRFIFTDIKEECRKELFGTACPYDLDSAHLTIQFLYESDIYKYVSEEVLRCIEINFSI